MLSTVPSLTKTLDEVATYVEETLGAKIAPTPWPERRLPHFLKENYAFYIVEFSGVTILLMLAHGTGPAPAALRKHIGLLRSKWDGHVVYITPTLTAYNRKRLVEQKVPFIVPGNQMYLPMEGIDFREHFRRQQQTQDVLSPSAQLLLLHLLLHPPRDVITPKDAAARMSYSAMTMTRAFNELEAAQLVRVTPQGKERHLRLGDEPKEVWARAQPLLSSPVKRVLCIRWATPKPPGHRAGLTALAESSMLAAPLRPSHALSRKRWTALRREHHAVEIPAEDPDALELQIWSYAPEYLARDNRVDPLSLYLSLRESDDERIAASLDELMETLRW
jgi:DNA-binding MarR family transcriptional regulator